MDGLRRIPLEPVGSVDLDSPFYRCETINMQTTDYIEELVIEWDLRGVTLIAVVTY